MGVLRLTQAPAAKSYDELFGDDPVVERMALVEQQGELGIARDFDVNLGHVAHFLLVRHRRHRALGRLVDAEGYLHPLGQDRATPAARAVRMAARMAPRLFRRVTR